MRNLLPHSELFSTVYFYQTTRKISSLKLRSPRTRLVGILVVVAIVLGGALGVGRLIPCVLSAIAVYFAAFDVAL
jgi:hypothetical protein